MPTTPPTEPETAVLLIMRDLTRERGGEIPARDIYARLPATLRMTWDFNNFVQSKLKGLYLRDFVRVVRGKPARYGLTPKAFQALSNPNPADAAQPAPGPPGRARDLRGR